MENRTYTQQEIQARLNAAPQRATTTYSTISQCNIEIDLEDGQSSWNPTPGGHTFMGPCVVRYARWADGQMEARTYRNAH